MMTYNLSVWYIVSPSNYCSIKEHVQYDLIFSFVRVVYCLRNNSNLYDVLNRGLSYMNIQSCLETLSLFCIHFNHISLYMRICLLKWERFQTHWSKYMEYYLWYYSLYDLSHCCYLISDTVKQYWNPWKLAVLQK